ncbi:hypothetical protein PACTADRAFT_40528 [Pachysolen tannophilus NRRL Y-2460]|uniref:Uncharacterized protein n=1 Tax=Pachysolen tannophilus NRRL Y-2460 TaxID=669874 RepID=A0A1E4TVF2_PACTA|nr:hypothetical protein PACTADRAFT_40528 [Pachysolen tannophilus NRRL Y-2460]
MENSLFFLQKISQNTINPIIVVVIITLKIVFEILLKILNYEFIKNKNLVTISTFCFQLDLRLQYICNFPVQFMAIKQKTVSLVSKPSLPSYDSSLEYIRFYNSLWLVFNDILLAVLIRPYLIYFKDIITNFLKEQIIDTLLYKDILMLLRWLMDNPAGFKLNYELSNFLGGLYIWAIQFWYQEFILKLFDLKMLRLFFATIINLGKIGGMTFTISFLLDFINIICFHIYSFNFSSTRIYNWQLNIIKSLFKLFYGKKYNILRNRIDSNNYDFDQLLLGIIIFTVLIYLLPTVVAFYVSFFALKVAIFLLVDLLQCTMLIINHFPIFLVLLKLKNSKRLPAGITFDIIDNHNTTTIIKMTSKTISLEKLFHYFSELIISSNTSNVNIFEDFIFTKFLGGDLINNIEYEKIYQKFKRINLPPSEKRIGVKELWDKLIDGYIRNDQNYDKSNKKIL